MHLRTTESTADRSIELAHTAIVLYDADAADDPDAPFPSSFPFAIPLTADTPQCIHTPQSALAHALPVPVSAKLRLCHPAPHTLALAHRLEAAGAAWLTLHARYPSARRRRHAAADLDQVRALKFGPEGTRAGEGDGDGDGGGVRIPVVSNGNVRAWADVVANKAHTGADGIMVGEALLANPW